MCVFLGGKSTQFYFFVDGKIWEKYIYEFLKDLSCSWNFKLNWWFCMLRLSWRDKQEASLRDHKQWVWRIASDFWEVFAIVFTSKIFSNFCRNALKSSNISLCRGRLRCELRLRHSDADIFTSLIICLQIWPEPSSAGGCQVINS